MINSLKTCLDISLFGLSLYTTVVLHNIVPLIGGILYILYMIKKIRQEQVIAFHEGSWKTWALSFFKKQPQQNEE